MAKKDTNTIKKNQEKVPAKKVIEEDLDIDDTIADASNEEEPELEEEVTETYNVPTEDDVKDKKVKLDELFVARGLDLDDEEEEEEWFDDGF